MKYCPLCTTKLEVKPFDGRPRLCCPDNRCGFVFWDNPVPVVAGIIETGQGIVLAHNRAWPPGLYSVITGYLESGESPEEAIIRETREELDLMSDSASLVGAYPVMANNQVIIAYHLVAKGQVRLNHELDGYQYVSKKDLGQYPFTDLALTRQIILDWLS